MNILFIYITKIFFISFSHKLYQKESHFFLKNLSPHLTLYAHSRNRNLARLPFPRTLRYNYTNLRSYQKKTDGKYCRQQACALLLNFNISKCVLTENNFISLPYIQLKRVCISYKINIFFIDLFTDLKKS